MMPSQQDFLAMVEHEKNHKKFIFMCGVVVGVVVSCMFFISFLNY